MIVQYLHLLIINKWLRVSVEDNRDYLEFQQIHAARCDEKLGKWRLCGVTKTQMHLA